MKKTVVLGASTKPGRYASIASNLLVSHGHKIVPVGIKSGVVANEEILDLRSLPEIPEVDTITMYIGTANQPAWYDYILSLKPKRIIFNPGTENQELKQMAEEDGIEVVYGCTLVMLRLGRY
ncbi:CoA-binding protein [Fulvivirgaceae bacterium BMA10]|uniref:CoA-binding protein n=1 Tax=Splendidivirga corallicola TaxID=3051826 RepID=A0ABT8KSD8_9BACT|nr:CoA-binding protein [Fulvivirgaceae bacterium BMA10]